MSRSNIKVTVFEKMVIAGAFGFHKHILFQGKITAVGKLLLQDTLLVAEVTSAAASAKASQPKFKERRVFLFEQIILFSEMTEKKRGNMVNAHYFYKNSLKVSYLLLIIFLVNPFPHNDTF